MSFEEAQQAAGRARENLAGSPHDHIRVVGDGQGGYHVEARRHTDHTVWDTIAR